MFFCVFSCLVYWRYFGFILFYAVRCSAHYVLVVVETCCPSQLFLAYLKRQFEALEKCYSRREER